MICWWIVAIKVSIVTGFAVAEGPSWPAGETNVGLTFELKFGWHGSPIITNSSEAVLKKYDLWVCRLKKLIEELLKKQRQRRMSKNYFYLSSWNKSTLVFQWLSHISFWDCGLIRWTKAEKGSKFWGQIEVAAGSLRFLKSEYNSPSLVQQYCSPEQHCWHTQRSVFFVAGFFYDSPTVWIFHDWAHTSLGSSKGMYRQGMCVKNIIYLIYSNNMWWVCKCECMYSKSLQENAYSVLSVCTVKVYKRMHIQYWVDVQFMSQRCEQYYVYKC